MIEGGKGKVSIQYYRNTKTGRTYAYESIAKWDPEKGYSVPIRTYLGRVDPTTNKIIPSSKKPGRKPKVKTKEEKEKQSTIEMRLHELEVQLRTAEGTIATMDSELKKARKDRDRMKNGLKRLQQELENLTAD